MKWVVLGLVVGLVLLAPQAGPLMAQTPSFESENRVFILTLIQLLEDQVTMLRQELAQSARPASLELQEHYSAAVYNSSALYQTTLYDGAYVEVYQAQGYTLDPVFGSSVESDHQLAWNRYVAVVGLEKVRELVSEFRIYDDRGTYLDAFSDKNPETGLWVIGLNVHGVDLDDPGEMDVVRDLFIHEYAHILIDEYPDVFGAFRDEFWGTAARRHAERVAAAESEKDRLDRVAGYYSRHEGEFVTEYAATNPEEDFAESFTFFVRGDRQRGATQKARKISFFFDYPVFVDERDRIEEG